MNIHISRKFYKDCIVGVQTKNSKPDYWVLKAVRIRDTYAISSYLPSRLPTPCLYTAYTLPVPCLHPVYTLPIACMHPACTLHAPCLYPAYTLSTPSCLIAQSDTTAIYHTANYHTAGSIIHNILCLDCMHRLRKPQTLELNSTNHGSLELATQYYYQY